MLQFGFRESGPNNNIPQAVTHEGNPTRVQFITLNVVEDLTHEGVRRGGKVREGQSVLIRPKNRKIKSTFRMNVELVRDSLLKVSILLPDSFQTLRNAYSFLVN